MVLSNKDININQKFFDTKEFNNKFEEYIKSMKERRLLREKLRLQELNNLDNIKTYPYELSFKEILINTQNCVNKYIENFTTKNYLNNSNNDDFFYLGILFISISLLFITLKYIFDS